MGDNVIKAPCPQCRGEKNAEVAAYFFHREDDDESDVWVKVNYRILQCRGCNAVFFQEEEYFSEDWETFSNPRTGEWEHEIPPKFRYWPSPAKREQPEWKHALASIDAELDNVFDELYAAVNNNMYTLAAIGVRTIFDKSAEILEVDTRRNFAEKVDQLWKKSYITEPERETLKILTNAGSAAAHRGWKPSPEEMDTMMSAIESFLYRTFVVGPAAKTLKDSIPERTRKR